MKYLGWILLAVFAVVVFWRQPTPADKSALHIAQARLAELQIDSADHARQIRELEDSLQRRLEKAGRGQDETRRRVPLDSSKAVLADSLRNAAVTMAELRMAYDTLRVAFDSSQRTVSIAQQATNDALTALAYSRLMHIADSTRLAQYEQAVPIVLAASKPNWWKNRIVLTGGWGATVVNTRVLTGPQVSVGVRLWAL